MLNTRLEGWFLRVIMNLQESSVQFNLLISIIRFQSFPPFVVYLSLIFRHAFLPCKNFHSPLISSRLTDVDVCFYCSKSRRSSAAHQMPNGVSIFVAHNYIIFIYL